MHSRGLPLWRRKCDSGAHQCRRPGARLPSAQLRCTGWPILQSRDTGYRQGIAIPTNHATGFPTTRAVSTSTAGVVLRPVMMR